MNIKIENYLIIACLKSEITGKLINRIQGSGILISSLPGSALRAHVECQQAFSKLCLVSFISQDTYLVFSVYANYNYNNMECQITGESSETEDPSYYP